MHQCRSPLARHSLGKPWRYHTDDLHVMWSPTCSYHQHCLAVPSTTPWCLGRPLAIRRPVVLSNGYGSTPMKVTSYAIGAVSGLHYRLIRVIRCQLLGIRFALSASSGTAAEAAPIIHQYGIECERKWSLSHRGCQKRSKTASQIFCARDGSRSSFQGKID